MKFLYSILLASFLVTNLSAQGIEFAQGSWDDALALAKKEDKLVFVDAYTTWCGPCKKMSRETFKDSEVGNYFNKEFVNFKMDMEKGEGPDVAVKYDVFVYPTLLFIDGEGNQVHRTAGYHDAAQFIALGKTAMDPNRRLSTLNAKYESGNRDPEFLYKFTQLKYDVYDGTHGQVAEEYLATQKDWSTDQNMEFLFAFVERTDSKGFEYLVDNKDAFSAKFGEQKVVSKIQNMIYETVARSKDENAMEKVDALYKRVYPKQAKQLSSAFRMTYYRQRGDVENYADAAVSYFDSFKSEDPDELNEAAWIFYQKVEDKKKLKKAVKWTKRSIKLDDNLFSNDTLAALYYKLGKKRKARKAALKAIELGKSSGEDFSSTQELLEKIKAM